MTTGRGPTGADWDANPVQPTPWPGFSGGSGSRSSDHWGQSADPQSSQFPIQPRADSTSWDLPVTSGSPAPVVGGTSGPPMWLLILSIVIPLATVPLLFVQDKLWVNIVGWAVAIFGSLGFLTAFTVIDMRRRTSRWYVDQPGLLAALRIAALAIGLVAAGCQAYQIADAVARWNVWVT